MTKMDNDARLSGRQIAAGRTLLGMTQPELAGRAGVSTPTIKRMEACAGPAVGMQNNVAAVRMALEAAGVEFIGRPADGAGVRLKPPETPGKSAAIRA
jgi:transcriptional regulator with XRE-family HTH domain